MYEKSFERPKNFFTLSGKEQYEIDTKLGILDWEGECLTGEEVLRFKNHYRDKDNE